MKRFGILVLFGFSVWAFAERKPENHVFFSECGHASRYTQVCLGKVDKSTDGQWIAVKKNGILDTAVRVAKVEGKGTATTYTGYLLVSDVNDEEHPESPLYFFEQRYELRVKVLAKERKSAELKILTRRLHQKGDVELKSYNIEKWEPQVQTRGAESEDDRE